MCALENKRCNGLASEEDRAYLKQGDQWRLLSGGDMWAETSLKWGSKHAHIWEKNFSGRGKSRCKGPEAGRNLTALRISKAASVSGAEWAGNVVGRWGSAAGSSPGHWGGFTYQVRSLDLIPSFPGSWWRGFEEENNRWFVLQSIVAAVGCTRYRQER